METTPRRSEYAGFNDATWGLRTAADKILQSGDSSHKLEARLFDDLESSITAVESLAQSRPIAGLDNMKEAVAVSRKKSGFFDSQEGHFLKALDAVKSGYDKVFESAAEAARGIKPPKNHANREVVAEIIRNYRAAVNEVCELSNDPRTRFKDEKCMEACEPTRSKMAGLLSKLAAMDPDAGSEHSYRAAMAKLSCRSSTSGISTRKEYEMFIRSLSDAELFFGSLRADYGNIPESMIEKSPEVVKLEDDLRAALELLASRKADTENAAAQYGRKVDLAVLKRLVAPFDAEIRKAVMETGGKFEFKMAMPVIKDFYKDVIDVLKNTEYDSLPGSLRDELVVYSNGLGVLEKDDAALYRVVSANLDSLWFVIRKYERDAERQL